MLVSIGVKGMKLTLAEPKFIKDSISTISELVSEARFQVTKDGLTLVAMDPANVAMVVFKLFSSCFVEYHIKEDVHLAINLANLKNVLKRIGATDLVTLSMTEDASKLVITISGKTTRTFSLPLLDIDEREQKIPNLQFGLKIVLPTEELTAAIEDMSIVSDSLAFSCDGSVLQVTSKGDSTDAMVEIPSGNGVTIEADGEEKLKSRYSIEYLKKMVTAGKISNTVVLQFAKDYPLRLEYFEKDRVQLAFVLAPRVEND